MNEDLTLDNEFLVQRRATQNSQLYRQWIDLVLLLVQRDLRVRYRGSMLGYLWSMLNPMLYMVILTLVFSHVVKVKTETYALFILSGIMTWNLFHQSVAIGMGSIVASGHLLKKVELPAFLFPTASIIGVLINFILSFIPLCIISLLLHQPLSSRIFLLPFFLAPYLLFVWGIVLCLSSINVKYRDVGHAMEPLLQMLFYASPVVYPLTIVPEKWRFLLELNPLAAFIESFRALLLGEGEVSWQMFARLAIYAMLAIIFGVLVYRKKRGQFIYNL